MDTGHDTHLENRSQLVREPGDNGRPAGGDRVGRVLEDVLLGEVPVAHAELTDTVDIGEVKHSRLGVLHGVRAHASLLGIVIDVLEPCGMVLYMGAKT